jgi:tRNA A-37 threonylcarbamoyl transferase component Bud32
MYETVLNRVRIFPPLAYGKLNIINCGTPKKEVETVFRGYMIALKQLEKENKLVFSNNYVMISKKFIVESNKSKIRLRKISKNAPRTLFTSLLASFPQLLNFFSRNTESLLKLQKLRIKREPDLIQSFVDPKKYVFVPTAKGLVSLADQLDIEDFIEKILLKGEKAKITFEQVGGVLNDVYLIRAFSDCAEKKVLVKRFKDWSGFKWFPLSLWSFGARNLAVLGRTRLEKECAMSEFLRCNGIKVPRILYVSHNKRLVFMEFIEGEDLSRAIKRIAKSKDRETERDLMKIEKAGEKYAQVHALEVTLGDTKPENVILDSNDNIYLLDFEQASHKGDIAWDLAVFLYYAGHYLQPLYSNRKAEAIVNAFICGYLKGGGDITTIKKAGSSKYTRIFSVFTMPSIIFAMSTVLKKAGKKR